MKPLIKSTKRDVIILIISSVFLISLCISFIVFNRIPYREIRIHIESEPSNCPIDQFKVYLTYEYTGNLFFLQPKYPFNNLQIEITPSLSIHDKLMLKQKKSAIYHKIDSIYCIEFPNDTSFIDSLVAMYKVEYLTNIDFNPLRIIVNGLTKHKGDEFRFYTQHTKKRDTDKGLFTGYTTMSFYKNRFSEFDRTIGGLSIYTFKSPRFYSPYDASQCYVRMNFKRDWPSYVNLTDSSKNIIKIDFKGPTIFEAIQPEPDSTTISSVIYTDLNKIRSIVNSEGFFAKVNLPLTQNLQNTRNFILMTIITVLFTTVCAVGYRILKTRFHRNKKRIVVKGFSYSTPDASKK